MYEVIITHEGAPVRIRDPRTQVIHVEWLGREWEIRRAGETVGHIVFGLKTLTMETSGLTLTEHHLIYIWTAEHDGWTADTTSFSTAVARIIEDATQTRIFEEAS